MNESTALLNNKPGVCTYKSVSPVSVQTNVLNVVFYGTLLNIRHRRCTIFPFIQEIPVGFKINVKMNEKKMENFELQYSSYSNEFKSILPLE